MGNKCSQCKDHTDDNISKATLKKKHKKDISKKNKSKAQ